MKRKTYELIKLLVFQAIFLFYYIFIAWYWIFELIALRFLTIFDSFHFSIFRILRFYHFKYYNCHCPWFVFILWFFIIKIEMCKLIKITPDYFSDNLLMFLFQWRIRDSSKWNEIKHTLVLKMLHFKENTLINKYLFFLPKFYFKNY